MSLMKNNAGNLWEVILASNLDYFLLHGLRSNGELATYTLPSPSDLKSYHNIMLL